MQSLVLMLVNVDQLVKSNAFVGFELDLISLLLRHWYEIMALYYVKSVLTEISASRQDRRVQKKSKIIRIKFLSIWGMLQTSRYVSKSRKKTILIEISQCTAVLYNDWSLQMGQMGPKITLGTLKTVSYTHLTLPTTPYV